MGTGHKTQDTGWMRWAQGARHKAQDTRRKTQGASRKVQLIEYNVVHCTCDLKPAT